MTKTIIHLVAKKKRSVTDNRKTNLPNKLFTWGSVIFLILWINKEQRKKSLPNNIKKEKRNKDKRKRNAKIFPRTIIAIPQLFLLDRYYLLGHINFVSQ